MNRANHSEPGFPISISEQISLLLRGGMAISDQVEAARFLGHVSFHRLRGYWEPFESPPSGDGRLNFQNGAAFVDVVERYNFDQKLRALLLDAFSYIEVAIRTQWTYNLAYVHGGGRLAHHDASLFSQGYERNLERIERDYETYTSANRAYSLAECPVWAIAETMSFGQLSRWYGDTRLAVRQSAARHYGMDEKIMKSLLRHLVVIRNICAHHERLWDRQLVSTFIIPNRLGNLRGTRRFFNRADSGKIYNALVMIAYLMEQIVPAAGWKRRLLALLDEHSGIPQSTMGFPSNWRRLDVWQSDR